MSATTATPKGESERGAGAHAAHQASATHTPAPGIHPHGRGRWDLSDAPFTSRIGDADLAPATTRTLDPASRAWLAQLHAEGTVREAAVGRLHALLLREARHEVRRRTAGLAHPSGRDLDDLAIQAADDALVVILRKLNQFRGEALFTTWAGRFAALEVPGEIRRRLGHTREAPMNGDAWPPAQATYADPEQCIEASEHARAVGHLITHELTAHQREVLLALTIDEITANDLAARLHSTPGAVYKTLHDARRKLKRKLAPDQQLTRRYHPAAVAIAARAATSRAAATPVAPVLPDPIAGAPGRSVAPSPAGPCSPRFPTGSSTDSGRNVLTS